MSRALLPNTTQIPDVILDEWMALLEGAELKVVLYVARRTYGFGKPADRISIGQMVNGIKRADGEMLDRGTGLSERAVQTACDYLVACGVLLRQRHVPEKHEVQLPAYFKINLAWESELLDRKKWRAGVSEVAEVPVKKPVAPPQPLHPCNDCTPAMSSVAPPQPLHPQETERQETEKIPPEDVRTSSAPPGGATARRRRVFEPPDIEEVRAFFAEKGRADLADEWWHYWDGVGWDMGRGKRMAKWRSAAASWILRKAQETSSPRTPPRNGAYQPTGTLDEQKAAILAQLRE